MKKILIIGNAKVHRDYKNLFNSANLIVRFNNPRLLGDFDDGRTDYLSIGDTGNPALIFLLQIKNRVNNNFYKIYKKSKNIIFSRNSDSHKKHFLKQKDFFKKSHLESHLSIADFFIPELKKDNKIATYVSKKDNDYCFKKLSDISNPRFICPSTGFLTIHYFLRSPKFNNYEKILIGFTFKGWKGHPWSAEKKVLLEYSKTNKITLFKERFFF